jgi:alkylation response protein AidB-like acyl-CoA dehydrogenase
MNFDFTDDQRAIKSTAREFLSARFTAEKVRELAEAGEYDDTLWTQIVELGWPGIFIAEQHGGQDLGTVELAILMEELGYALAPAPFFSNAAAGLLVAHAGSDEQRERYLPGVAAGDSRGAVAVLSNGRAPLVADADSAAFVVLVDGNQASVVDASDARIEPVRAIDATRRFSTVDADGGDPLEGDVQAALDRIAVALAAELTGVAQRTLELSVEYTKERKQFDRPIGSFQAISHRCAQMMLETEGSRATTLYAAWAADHEPESLALAASMAKAYASDAGWRVTAAALQVHGGIGFTWEHDLHFFLKRAKTDAYLFGTAREHRDRVADLVGLSRSAAAV